MPLKLLASGAARAPESLDFAGFYARYFSRVEAYARRCFGPDNSEEIAQEVMARALDHFNRLDLSTDPWNWLCVVTRNYGRQLCRRQRPVELNEEQFADVIDESATLPEQHVLNLEQTALLTRALARLAPIDRQLLLLRHIDERSVGDIATFLGDSENLTRQKLFRARKRLATQFASLGGRLGVVFLPVWRLLRRNSAQSTTVTSGLAAMTAVIGAAVIVTGLPSIGAPTVRITPKSAVQTANVERAMAPAQESVTAPKALGTVHKSDPATISSRPSSGPVGTRLDVTKDPRKPGTVISALITVDVGPAKVYVGDDAQNGEGKSLACYVAPTSETC